MKQEAPDALASESMSLIMIKNNNGVTIKTISYRISDYNKIKKALLETDCV